MSRTIELFADKIPGTDVETPFESKASYIIGQIDYYNKRYTLTVRKAERGIAATGYTSESYALFADTNLRETLEHADRYSQKRLRTLAESPSILEKAQAMKAKCISIYQIEQSRQQAELAAV